MSGIASAEVARDAAGARQGDRPARVRLIGADRDNDGAHQQHHENEQQQR